MRLRATLFTTAALFLLLGTTWAGPADKSQPDYTEPTLGIPFIQIKGGSFLMGDLTGRGEAFERPAHEVTVKDFYIGKYELTFAEYDKYCDETGAVKPDDEGWGRNNRPVINVSWEDAVKFASWLSKKNKRIFRLPSEAEWEYAARAGKSTPYWWGHKMAPTMANCRDCDSSFPNQTAPVGSFTANPWGLFDMNGNVWEWVADDFHGEETGYRGVPDDGSPWLDGNASGWKLYRGGSFRETSFDLRNSARCFEPSQKRSNIGIRLVVE